MGRRNPIPGAHARVSRVVLPEIAAGLDFDQLEQIRAFFDKMTCGILAHDPRRR
jgi:hypothetical protein